MAGILLTGGTGLIGRYLLRDLMCAGESVVALVRPDKDHAAEQRLERIMTGWEKELGRALLRPQVLQGDLHQPGLGLTKTQRAWLGVHCRTVLHNAGNVSFHATDDNEPWRTNVEGTAHLIEAAQAAGIRDFQYVSTAYVCGDRQGVIREAELEAGQSFGSVYEESKYTAEKLVRAAGFEKLNVFRPGSVTGDWLTGATTTYHGVYLFAQFTQLARQRSGVEDGQQWHHPVRLFQNGDEAHHLIPVCAVSRAIVAILRQRELPGETYHLTPDVACNARELEAALADYFGYHGVTFAGNHCVDRATMNEVEQIFYDTISRAEHRYSAGDPHFDCTNTKRAVPEWRGSRIDHDYLLRIFDYAVQQRFGRGRVKSRSAKVA